MSFDIQEAVFMHLKKKKVNEACELMAEELMEKYSFYSIRNDQKQELWIYQDGIYVSEGLSFVAEYVRSIVLTYYSSYLKNKVAERIIVDNYVEESEFFNKTNFDEVPLLNGVLNIKTRKLRDYDVSKDIFFNKIPISYISTAKCPSIDKFFREILLNENDVNVIYELFGYVLDSTHFIEKAFMFVGDGRNGKGKTLELFKRFIGASNCASVPLVSMKYDSFNLHQLFSKRVNLAGDLDNTSLKDTGTFKSITGRDTITAHRKFMTDLIFMCYAKHIFACNELPRVYDMSKGFWSRWILFQFPYEFVESNIYNTLTDEEKKFKKLKDPDIIDKISTPEEMSGLLNAALDGLDRLRIKKDFSSSKGVDEIKNFWVRKASSFTAFCFDMIEDDVDSTISKDELRKKFKDYCRKHNLKGASDPEIKRTLEELFGVTDMQNSTYDRVWKGIKFKVQQEQQGFSALGKNDNFANSSKKGVVPVVDNEIIRICPSCKSTDTHIYADFFQCFSCKIRTKLEVSNA